MARPIRFAPVLEGDEAVEFYERWQETLKTPDPTYPSEERIKAVKDFIKRHELEKLNK
jgi:hypothetical protein